MKYKGIRMQLLGITLMLIGIFLFTFDQTMIKAYLFYVLAVIGATLSIVGFFVKN